ncbi:MAG: YigZ family protein [Campylobacterota bacterium]|nr:YigZ family protein [Campylobacterota bacterium]
MYYINKEYQNTLEIKKSKFITHICQYKDFKTTMNRLKDEYPKARHFVYAYRYLNEFDQIVENSSDDGEPKGTSGRPSLNVLSGGDIINSAVIIVRYFGGIRLGTGGLVKAYSDAVNLVLNNSNLIEYKKLIRKSLIVSYSNLSLVEYTISLFSVNIIEKLFENDVKLILEASKEEFVLLQEKLIRECELIDE